MDMDDEQVVSVSFSGRLRVTEVDYEGADISLDGLWGIEDFLTELPHSYTETDIGVTDYGLVQITVTQLEPPMEEGE